MLLDFFKDHPERIYKQFIHSSLNIDFYILWLLIKIVEENKGWKNKYGEGFIRWSPYFEDKIESNLNHICTILTRLLYFGLATEVYLELFKYDENSDNLKLIKEYHLNKENCIDKAGKDIWFFVTNNGYEITTNEFYVKLIKDNAQKYIDEYLQNCINDDISDSQFLLINFENQLEKVRQEIIDKRSSFGKRKFRISLEKDFLVYKNEINLFATLYYLEKNGYIQIYNLYDLSIKFDGKIPNSFIISITDDGMEYLDEFDYLKKINKSVSGASSKSKSVTKKELSISFDEMKKELIIDGKRKKLLQKQVIFIEATFDLKEKGEDGWVALEEIAICDDHLFASKGLKQQEKIIKNFYNIGNHLNKSIVLETGFEKVFELTLRAVRINPKFKS